MAESDVNLLGHDEDYDVHAISGLLKLYLRELPTSILTSDRRDDFVKITEMEDKNEKIAALNKLVHSLPEANFALLKALSGHLLRIVDNSDVNKMTIRNVGIVFSPTLNIPAQVFSMFLHEYRYIFFREGEAPAAPPPQPPRSPMPPMMSPRTQNFEFPERPTQRMTEPPRTPMLPSHPAAIRPPGMAQQVVSYEPNYDMQPQITSPTQISGPRFDNIAAPSGDSSGSTTLAVPGSDAKNNKSRRRESSMMFMMGGLKKSSFQKSNNGEFNPLSVPDCDRADDWEYSCDGRGGSVRLRRYLRRTTP
jgi:RalA-binding protein 1